MAANTNVAPATNESTAAWQTVMNTCVRAFMTNSTVCIMSDAAAPTALDQGLSCTPPRVVQVAEVVDLTIKDLYCSGNVNINVSSATVVDDCCARAAIIGAYANAVASVSAAIPPSQLACVNLQLFGAVSPPPAAVTAASSALDRGLFSQVMEHVASTCVGGTTVQYAVLQNVFVGGGGVGTLDCTDFIAACNTASVSVMCILTSIAGAISQVAPDIFLPSTADQAAATAAASGSHKPSSIPLYGIVLIVVIVALVLFLLARYAFNHRDTASDERLMSTRDAIRGGGCGNKRRIHNEG